MKKSIAFFDFDGTITNRDTLLEFIRFAKGNARFLLGFLVHSPYIAAYKLKLISNQRAKEKVLKHFFGGMSQHHFNELAKKFSGDELPGLIRKGALEEIIKLKAEGTEVVVVSASPENWIRYWTDGLGLTLLASSLDVEDDKITGRLAGMNCHGKEKVRRILEKYDIGQFAVIHAYGDTTGDLPMLELAHVPHFKPFRTNKNRTRGKTH